MYVIQLIQVCINNFISEEREKCIIMHVHIK
jgi:hypothetical protein